MPIGEIVTGSDLADIQRMNARLYSQRAYFAPTVYRLASRTGTKSWFYFKTLAEAMAQYAYVTNVPGSKAVTPAGKINFSSAATAQTLGINVDFFYKIPVIGTTYIPYEYLRAKMAASNVIIPFRFYKTDGSGPYYSILLNSELGISATVINNVAPSKLQAMDDYQRQLQLLKTKYNTLALYLSDLSKKQLKPVQQQSFNEGVLLISNMRAEMQKIKGIDIVSTPSGTIGEPITFLVILMITIIAGAFAWTASTWITETQKTQRINDSFKIQEWIAEQKLKLAVALKQGLITQSEYNEQIKSLDDANVAAQKVVTVSSAETPGFLDKVQNLLLIGLVGLGIVTFAKK